MLAVALAAPLLLVAGCGGHAVGPGKHARPGADSAFAASMVTRGEAGRARYPRPAVDGAFIAQSVLHDEDAIAAADLAAKRAGHPALRELAQRFRARARAEIRALDRARRHVRRSDTSSRVLGLPAWKMRRAFHTTTLVAGTSFDKTFTGQLLAADDAVIHIAGVEAFDGRDAALRSFAHGVVLERAHEIEQVERWQRLWHGS